MIVEPREDQPRISIVTRSKVVTGNDKANWKKQAEATWVRKTTEKSFSFDILKENKIFMEARQSFMDDGALIFIVKETQKDNCEIVLVATQNVDLNILKYFL